MNCEDGSSTVEQLLHNHEDQNLDPSIYVKSQVSPKKACNPSSEKDEDKRPLRASAFRPIQDSSPRLRKRPCLRGHGESNGKGHPAPSSGFRVHAGTCVHALTQTYTHKINKNKF